MNRFQIPNFRGQHALLIHRDDEDCARLSRQLERLGITVRICEPNETELPDVENSDLIFFDADQAYEDLFPWKDRLPPVPTIAIFSTETPGRLELALHFGIGAYLVKPLRNNGIYSAVVIATHSHRLSKENRQQLNDLQERAKLRPIVFDSLVRIMEVFKCDNNEAFKLLRQASMAKRVTIEEMSLQISTNEHSAFERIKRSMIKPNTKL